MATEPVETSSYDLTYLIHSFVRTGIGAREVGGIEEERKVPFKRDERMVSESFHFAFKLGDREFQVTLENITPEADWRDYE